MTLSARNRLEGNVMELQLGGVMAHVVVQVGDNLIESVITRRSAEEMNLKVGDRVAEVIKSKAASMSIGADHSKELEFVVRGGQLNSYPTF